MTLPEFSVRQTVFVNVLFFVCMIGGWNALKLTEVEYFHDVVLNQVVVTTTWTGASADEVERLVTAKLEDELMMLMVHREPREVLSLVLRMSVLRPLEQSHRNLF